MSESVQQQQQQQENVVNLGPVRQIPAGEGKSFHVGGRDIVVFRTRAGELYATQARCPHRGGPLADGILGGTIIQCPLHGFSFDVATGHPVGNDCAALTRFRVDVSASDEILLRL